MGGTMKLKALKMGLLGLAMGGMAACDFGTNDKGDNNKEEELPEPIEVGVPALFHSDSGCKRHEDGTYYVCNDTLARGVIKTLDGKWPLNGEKYFICLSDDNCLVSNAPTYEGGFTPCSNGGGFMFAQAVDNPVSIAHPELGNPSFLVTFPKEECEAFKEANPELFPEYVAPEPEKPCFWPNEDEIGPETTWFPLPTSFCEEYGYRDDVPAEVLNPKRVETEVGL
jgi:hypothetical protein